MEHIENPWVLGPLPGDNEEPKALEECQCCGCELFHGDRYFKIGSDFFCEDCVEKGELDGEDYMPDWED